MAIGRGGVLSLQHGDVDRLIDHALHLECDAHPIAGRRPPIIMKEDSQVLLPEKFRPTLCQPFLEKRVRHFLVPVEFTWFFGARGEFQAMAIWIEEVN